MSQRLYKYKSVSDSYDESGKLINRDIDNLIHEQLWVSSLENMNDPLECGFYVSKSFDLNKISDFQQNLLRSYACISFSTSVACRRLWNYYTDGMRGMVIEYSDSSIRQALKNDSIYSRVYQENKSSNLSLEGHAKSGNIVEITPDCGFLVSASNDNSIKVWNLFSNELAFTLEGHEDLITSIAISSDGRTLVSASNDQSIIIWDLRHHRIINKLLVREGEVSSLAISSNKKYLASALEDNTIQVWDIHNMTCLRVLEGHTRPITSLVFSTGGAFLVSSSYDETIKVWNYLEGVPKYSIEKHTGPILSVAIDDRERFLAGASTDNSIYIWSLEDGHETMKLNGHTDWVNKVFFLDDYRCISASYDNSIRVWDWQMGECINVFENSESIVDSIACPRYGDTCFYISSDGNVSSINLFDYAVSGVRYKSSDKKAVKNKTRIKTKAAISDKAKVAYEGRVIYDGKKTDLSNQYKQYLDKQTESVNIDLDALFHKDNSWEDEKEYRFAFSFKHLLNHRVSNIKPTAIYVGYRMSNDNIEKIRDYCELNKIVLYKYTPSFHSESCKKYSRTTIFDPKAEGESRKGFKEIKM